ncbi:unnamed protein product [Rotaria socialis]|uniref:Nitric oxide synthase n=1 Tax=Rotaria socialis TaxID=392032 RepID=A0A818EIE3_9BILA|nr:unnamed protein product [Rotaria socialis]CAF3459598.1 unnamed protein product [Rotaria socialis]CAF4530121.1 unnamed protein product [Rotaria socialis]CAF4531332.1 unnamed protein product [Rotaria socialis]
MKLKNYQTNQSIKVTGPVSNLHQDCRHQVCTSTLMSLPAYDDQERSESQSYDELQRTSSEYIFKEAYEFLSMYQTAKGLSVESFRARLDAIKFEIESTGLYAHTTAEIEYGCQLAWRNSARCINRLYWSTLEVLDKRNITSNHEMFVIICDHLRMAYNQGVLKATILVMNREARLWSTQYLRFACYQELNGSLIGDPMNQELTKAAMKLGWNKPLKERTQWDLLPIIVQCDPNLPPSWFELPEDLRPIVFLSHPDPTYDAAMKSLGLRWIAQPFVSDKAVEIGGIVYKCVPFSGWFMETEIGRNLCDIQRYNIIPKLAALLDLDVTAAANAQLNVDRIYVEVNAAILHSFQQAKITIVDHHTAAAGFMKFMREEAKDRGNTPADWVWLVPPISSGMSVLFHQEMLNYVVRPRVIDQCDPWTYYQPFQMYCNDVKISHIRRNTYFFKVLRIACIIIGLAVRAQKKQISIHILYASTTGIAKSYAEQIRKRLIPDGYRTTLAELDAYSFHREDKTQAVTIIITSTFGQGNAPEGGQQLEKWLKKKMNEIDRCMQNQGVNFSHLSYSQLKKSLQWCTYAVCAIGSSAYPSFCGFGKLIDRVLQLLGAHQLVPLVTCDALHFQYRTFDEWTQKIIVALKKLDLHNCETQLHQQIPLLPSCSSPISSASNIEPQNSLATFVRPQYIPLNFDGKIDEISTTQQVGPFTKDNPYNAVVLKNIELIGAFNSQYDCAAESPETRQQLATVSDTIQNESFILSECNEARKDEYHSVRLIVFETVGWSYCPGDHVCILPENTIENINAIILACGWQLESKLLSDTCSLACLSNNKYKTLREILTWFVDLTSAPRPDMLNIIATYATNTNEQRQIMDLGKGERFYENWLNEKPTIIDMLNQFGSIKIPIEDLIQLLPPIQPRYYSISSSNFYYPNQLHITVSVVTNRTPKGSVREGLCSNYLQRTTPMFSQDYQKIFSPHSQKPSKVRLFISPNSYFRLPGQESLTSHMMPYEITKVDSLLPLNSPILMFAVGSGIAPFRSFWQEMQTLQRLCSYVKVERILFIGVRTPNALLFAKELQDIINETNDRRLLTAIIPVYSRARPGTKKYIQEVMSEYKHMVYSILIQQNAYIYICGSIQSCLDIESALASIIQLCHPNKLTQLEAMNIIKQLAETGRLRKDMYG